MATQQYQAVDIKNTLYDNLTLTSNGQSTAVDFDRAGGCPDAELWIKLSDLEGTGALTLVLQDDNVTPGSLADLPVQLVIPAQANGTYILPLNNKLIKGQKFGLRHAWTAGSDGDGFGISAHIRPAC